jgi:predicted nucleotidyltransferase
VRRLRQALAHVLSGLWLFGSKARGESSLDSDIDLLVVLTTVRPETQRLIWGLGSDVSLEYDVLLNVHIVDIARWQDERHYRGTLWEEIERDGILLTQSVPEPIPPT